MYERLECCDFVKYLIMKHASRLELFKITSLVGNKNVELGALLITLSVDTVAVVPAELTFNGQSVQCHHQE